MTGTERDFDEDAAVERVVDADVLQQMRRAGVTTAEILDAHDTVGGGGIDIYATLRCTPWCDHASAMDLTRVCPPATPEMIVSALQAGVAIHEILEAAGHRADLDTYAALRTRGVSHVDALEATS